MRFVQSFALSLTLLALAGCPATETAPEPPAATPAPVTKPAPKPTVEEAPVDPKLLDAAAANATAPENYVVKFETTKGDILFDVTRAWAPNGADRFYNLVQIGYFDDVAFFRVIDGFMAQVGIHGSGKVNAVWREARIDDDPVKQTNARGMVSFATAGPNTRTTQFFINFGENTRLDGMGFAPFAKVRSMDVADTLYKEYGEGAPMGKGPRQDLFQKQGNAYLKAQFPNLDYIVKATIAE